MFMCCDRRHIGNYTRRIAHVDQTNQFNIFFIKYTLI